MSFVELASATTLQWTAAVILFAAVVHSFLGRQIQQLAHRFEPQSVSSNLSHLFGEVEVIFGFWAGVLVLVLAMHSGVKAAVAHVEALNYTEALFVFVIMAVASTQPLLDLAEMVLNGLSRVLPFALAFRHYFVCLFVGPLLGSFLTEPAAMIVVALILQQRYFRSTDSSRFKMVTLATLLVNISIGGSLTSFAAPPVLMVASKWNWDSLFMFNHFGYKAVIAVCMNSLLATFLNFRELREILNRRGHGVVEGERSALRSRRLSFLHFIFLLAIVLMSHHAVVFMGLFLFFLGVVKVTAPFQTELRIRESLLVAFFLGGLVVLGSMQSWWIRPILLNLNDLSLYLGTAALTAVTDNAALTYLGSQVEGLTLASKSALVGGALVGGGLTVMANAPNPIAFSVFKESFGELGISSGKLFLFALPPTLVALVAFWFL